MAEALKLSEKQNIPRLKNISMSILLDSPVEALRQYVEHPSVSADPSFASGDNGVLEILLVSG